MKLFSMEIYNGASIIASLVRVFDVIRKSKFTGFLINYRVMTARRKVKDGTAFIIADVNEAEVYFIPK